MGETWGITGPDFLRGYAVAFAVAVLCWVAVRLIARSGPRSTSADASPHSLLTLDELAYLAGGPRRVAETALARLLDGGLVRPSRSGQVQVVAGATSANRVDRALLSDAGGFRHRTVRVLIDKVGRSGAVDDVRAALTGKGLLVDQGPRYRVGSVLALGLLFAVGVVRLVAGAAGGRPFGWLLLFLAVTLLTWVVLARRPLPTTTHAGQRVLAEAGAVRVGEDSGAALLGGVAGLVAFGGLAAFPDAEISSVLELKLVAAQSYGGVAGAAGSNSTWSYSDAGSTTGFGSGGGSGCASSGGSGGCGGGGCGGGGCGG
ncbi:TIGR04222 domain-containing membrane protein [Actinokineospora spheciospongiae]|uniref:TIGR04222 domain-containing membrane protein n=1 Tax=Actinokineospora spheciospongiae TaxID=909613 RepID=UPI000D816B32|nr:TIGR04222 domain-containing membrane protein [Actinokineospora spheciospongiae]PWW62258.1 uncharacterized protein (TIGR04222 family) [Actinokineospora spheciospongiae]